MEIGIVDQNYVKKRKKLRRTVLKIGKWTSILTAILAAVFIIMGGFGSSSWDNIPGIVNYVWSYIKVIDYALFIPAFLLAPVFVILMACVHYFAPVEKKIFSLIGLCFAIIYSTIIITDYFLLWTVTLPSIIHGETASLSLLSMYNPHGIFVALETLAYTIMGLSLAFIAPVFYGGKIERALRWIFLGGFILTILSFIGISYLIIFMGYDLVMLEIAIITIYCPILIISGILLGMIFRKAENKE